jgi:Carboxypeptidase regulatory-like domain
MIRYAIIFFAAILPLAAQTSSLQGVIKDAQGASIPAAVVTITNTDTSAMRKEVSDDTGTYRFLLVQPGPYKLEVQKPGFSSKATNVLLQVDQPVNLDLQLEVGQTTNVVNVTAETTTINTENAAVGNPFTTDQIENLPLQTRNIVSLLSIEPGVTSTGNVMGSRSNQNNVTLDGADQNGFSGTAGFNAALPIPLDSVQEFKTTVGGLGADQGYTSGGQVTIVTKSGTNQFHGSLYEFNRNTDFEANDFFSNRAGVSRPALIRNQYGGTIGGPIKKNKLFFFYNFEGRKDRSQTAKTDQVPSPTLHQGIVEVLTKQSTTPVQLNAAAIQQIDPLGIGENPFVANLISQYPQGNNPLLGTDKGLNFYGLTFNAAQPLNNHVQVGKLDYTLNSKMTFSLRGTLNGASTVSTTGLAQFPGQSPSQETLDNSRGLSARYTYVITPNLVNAFNFGFTRGGQSSTGNLNVVPTFGFTALSPTPRASATITPVTNYTDDLTWTHGRHIIQGGMNFHHLEYTNYNYGNEPAYSFNNQTLLNLGNDISGDVTTFLQKTTPGVALSSVNNVASGFGAIFGMLNNASATDNFGVNGQAIPFGSPITREYKTNTPEFYIQDSWKVKSNFTFNYGLRYSIYGVPYEAQGVQVQPTVPLNTYFAQRQASANYGVPNYDAPDAYITYAISGPVNNGPGFYPTSYNDLAPHVGIAYSPTGELEKILGKGSVLRAGWAIIYDNYGTDMAANLASKGTPGLTNSATQLVNTNYTTALRYNGSTVPALTQPGGGAFPYTPPLAQAGFVSFEGVSNDLKAPYEQVMNLNYARPLPKHMSIEVGYAGRLSERGISQQDYGQPLSQFVDPKSGQSWQQAAGVLASLHNAGLTPAQVKANPSLVPLQPFFQDMVPGAAAAYLPGVSGATATAGIFYDAFQNFAGSWLDTLNEQDRIHQTGGGAANGGCLFITGCNTAFPTQFSGISTYSNDVHGAYNAALVTLRRTLYHGWGYDFNYTWSHAIDDGIGSTSPQNSFNPSQSMGPSSFDMRHQISANATVAIPVGKGKTIGSNMPMWADEIVGGWVASTLFTFYSGAPLNCTASSQYNVNYFSSSLCNLYPGLTSAPNAHLQTDQNGIPSLFSNTNVGADFVPGQPGIPGYNGLMRGLPFWNDDMALNKNFRLPKESMRLTLRIEAYNVFNKQEFHTPGLTISQLVGTTPFGSPSNFGALTNFGEITSSQSVPRVLQAVARFTF